MKIVDHLSKKGLMKLDENKTRQNVQDEITKILSGKPLASNISEILAHANSKLGPFDEDVKSLNRMAISYKSSAAKKPAAKKVAARKAVAKKKTRK
jgi:hypothetical protein